MMSGQVMGSSFFSAFLNVMRRCSVEAKLPYRCQNSWSTAMMMLGFILVASWIWLCAIPRGKMKQKRFPKFEIFPEVGGRIF